MKNRTSFALTLLALVITQSAWAQSERCEAKRGALENEIAYARAHGNKDRVSGLETALSKLTANCTDAALDAKTEQKIRDAQKKVDERERDLEKAKKEGKSQSKIAQRQRKLDEAHAELQRVQVEAAK
ncbi:DUF1090 domain-containing protein [Cupriavidus pauculus]|uniref:DUF1090 domain-containing protein n=1 Tax=Cupriavidus pauculus TaxID=82633 RepID=UPI001EE257E0|nr:DUF1090 domain-containing protein [Cupriavidus pauculus]GJG96700.1 DUF1090 domain-containing protein [Cupriavidus pauculus]